MNIKKEAIRLTLFQTLCLRKIRHILSSILTMIILFPVANGQIQAQEQLTPEKAYEIAKEAYLYTYPMVENYYTMYQFSIDKTNTQYKGPINTLSNIARVFTPEDTTIVTPNSDTPYSYLIVDLRAEPLVVSLPAIEENRYYSLQIVDLSTHNVDYIGTREDGNGGGDFLLAGPGWKGQVPQGIKRVINIPTELGLVLYRTQLLNDTDLEHVKKIQDQYKVRTLSKYEGNVDRPSAVEIGYPKIERSTINKEFWNLANFLLQFAPPLASEAPLRERFAAIGLTGGPVWDDSVFSEEIRHAIEQGQKDAHEEIVSGVSKLTTSVGLFGTPDEMAGKYLQRAIGAMGGIYGNSSAETIYPAYQTDDQGRTFDTSKYNYTLTFAEGKLPPVNAFWSVTMYDANTRLLVKNPLNRYLINSPMLSQLKKNAEGGITIYIQHRSPGADLESNWLPAPDGPMSMVMRLYLPRQEVETGHWIAPVIKVAGEVTP